VVDDVVLRAGFFGLTSSAAIGRSEELEKEPVLGGSGPVSAGGGRTTASPAPRFLGRDRPRLLRAGFCVRKRVGQEGLGASSS